jgi:hypothetical protein
VAAKKDSATCARRAAIGYQEQPIISCKPVAPTLQPALDPGPQPKPSRQGRASSTLAVLAESFPALRSPVRPLKRNIHLDPLAQAPITPDETAAALPRCCNSFAYLRACREGAARIDLDGNVVGPVTAEQAAFAAPKLAARMVVRPRLCAGHFLAWTLLSRYVLERQIELESLRAAQPHLNAEELGAVTILLPPDAEQRAIASFLDRETAKIDELVAKIREVIDRVMEMRAALISAAVTGKIDLREEAA